MATTSAEPRNPFYFLLLLSGLLFVVTVLAMVVVPVLEQRALQMEKGPRENLPPISELRNRIDRDGVLWILYEVSAIIFFGLMSMFLDRLRRHRAAAAPLISPPEPSPAPADATTNIKAGEPPANPTLAASTPTQPVAAPQPAQSNKKKKKKRK